MATPLDANFVPYAERFLDCFNTELDQFVINSGFDIVAFDRWAEVPSGISLTAHLQQHYGMEADQLIDELIRVRPYYLDQVIRKKGADDGKSD